MSHLPELLWSGKQKQTVLIWLAVYPIITGLVWALEPVLNDMSIPLRTLLLSVLMVPIMVYIAMPLIQTLSNQGKSQ